MLEVRLTKNTTHHTKALHSMQGFFVAAIVRLDKKYFD
jgi:hypothetical protein